MSEYQYYEWQAIDRLLTPEEQLRVDALSSHIEVTASYAMLGDIIFAEPNALVGFAGPRVIEQTIRQTLPEGFQRSEFLLRHGIIDRIIPRKELKQEICRALRFFEPALKKK